MKAIIAVIDGLNYRIGRAVMWLAVLTALVQFATVILRYVFSIGFIPMQESIWYMHAILFMTGAGFTLLQDGHVRVDVLYREASPRKKALVDLFGALFLLLPVCVAAFWLSLGYVSNSWRILERSTEVSGLPLIFALKTFIWVFAVLVGLQGVAMALRAVVALKEHDETYSAAGIARDSVH
ncbi:TRAP transporter small permease subunit [Afifella marina]|uniref:TRAP transporter small permease protein n=1 Tax=Afifella marina DSM 2698 TaxID=1120955 RepID=A0A1G5NQI3_AFIMA|nr:TRAP transporter small permease subunit [Afifella marina]SCZ39208.1 TRAP-type mannitol/chloroaromatic compound transport system, small permease component [Afifella marina DSM 2698]